LLTSAYVPDLGNTPEPTECGRREKSYAASIHRRHRRCRAGRRPAYAGARRRCRTYEINAILSLTGTFAFLGNAEATSLRTLEPLINKQGGINGQPVHFNIADDQSQPASRCSSRTRSSPSTCR